MTRRWIPLLLFLLQLPLYAGYLTDDSYIYAQFARNLAQRGELAFNAGEPVNAATSPLWAGLGAVGVWLGVDPFWWLKALGMVCGALSVWMFAATLSRLRPPDAIWWLAALGFAAQPWFVRWSSSGMETALASLCVVSALYALTGEWSRRDAICFGAAMGLGPLLRPELLLFTALGAWTALRQPRHRLATLLPAAIPVLLWGFVAWSHTHSFLPSTMGAKSTDAGLVLARFAYNLRVMGQIVSAAMGLPLLLFLFELWRRRRLALARTRVGWMLLWLPLLPGIYLLRDVQLISRYMEIWTPVMAIAIAAQVRPRRWSIAVWALQILLGLGLGAFRIAPSTAAFSRSIDAALGDIAAWLRDQSDPQDLVAVYDIGLIGYRSERRILDLGGLIDADIARLRRQFDDEQIVRDGMFLRVDRPRYLIHRAERPDALAGSDWDGVEPRSILSREVANLGVSRGQPVHYTLYELVN